jgi:COP9 signalosome complex subunit 5
MMDQIYVYNDAGIEAINKARPWRNSLTQGKYFRSCRINVLAATKMVKHAIQGVNAGRKKGGLPTEIMGLLVGRPDADNPTSIVIMDCIELPIEGSETKVVADDEKVLGFMTRMQDRIEELRKDRFIGWYHSHPFEVGAHSNCFFSGTDVNTQLLWQMQFGKWVGIVVDPLRCLAKQKVELMSFMAYPPDYDPPKNEGPDLQTATPDVLSKRWGAAYNRYYVLSHSFFMGSLVRHNLEMMSRKHLWIRHLSASAILEPENRDELPKRIQTMVKATNRNAEPMHRKGNASAKTDPMKESMAMGRDLAVEQCIGHSTQLIKNAAFNSTISADTIKYSTATPQKGRKGKGK